MIIVAFSIALVALVFGAHTRPPARRVEPLDPLDSRDRSVSRRHHRFVTAVSLIGLVSFVALIDPLLAIGAIVVAFAWARLRSVVATRRQRRAIEHSWPDAIEMLVLIVHAGMTPHQAIEVLADRAPEPTRFAFVEVARRVNLGATLADALTALPELLGSGASAVADTLAIAERHGAPIARTLEQLGVDVRERRRRHAEAHARTLPVKMSFPLVMCTLPAFVLISIVPAVLAALRSLGGSGF